MTDLILDVLAVYRATRLIVDDEIGEPIREPLLESLEKSGHTRLAYLMQCYWCSSIWVAALCLTIRWRAPRLWESLRWMLATSAATGIIANQL